MVESSLEAGTSVVAVAAVDRRILCLSSEFAGAGGDVGDVRVGLVRLEFSAGARSIFRGYAPCVPADLAGCVELASPQQLAGGGDGRGRHRRHTTRSTKARGAAHRLGVRLVVCADASAGVGNPKPGGARDHALAGRSRFRRVACGPPARCMGRRRRVVVAARSTSQTKILAGIRRSGGRFGPAGGCCDALGGCAGYRRRPGPCIRSDTRAVRVVQLVRSALRCPASLHLASSTCRTLAGSPRRLQCAVSASRRCRQSAAQGGKQPRSRPVRPGINTIRRVLAHHSQSRDCTAESSHASGR